MRPLQNTIWDLFQWISWFICLLAAVYTLILIQWFHDLLSLFYGLVVPWLHNTIILLNCLVKLSGDNKKLFMRPLQNTKWAVYDMVVFHCIVLKVKNIWKWQTSKHRKNLNIQTSNHRKIQISKYPDIL